MHLSEIYIALAVQCGGVKLLLWAQNLPIRFNINDRICVN
jgi:hypothetical protein